MKRVIVESPFRGETVYEKLRNYKYLSACVVDSLRRGEAPFASHSFYPRFLDDSDPTERQQGMACGRAWAAEADIVAFYVDYGVSSGMLEMLEFLTEEWEEDCQKGKVGLRPFPEFRRLPREGVREGEEGGG